MGRKTLRKASLGLMLILVLVGCRQQIKTEENSTVAVEVITVEEKDIEEVITLRGQLKPKEERMIIVKTPGLRVTKLSVEVGQQVKVGSFLFELDKSLVRKQVEQAKMGYDLAKENYGQQKQLLHNNPLQKSPLELQEETSVFKNVGRIPAQYQAMMSEGVEGQNKAAMEASLRAASVQLEQARLGYTNALEQLKEMEYFAPMSGVVSQINIQENQMALNNAPSIVVSNTDELKVVLSVSASLLMDIQKGQRVTIRKDQQQFEGVVSIVNPVTDARNNLHTVEIVISNPSDKIISGGFVHVDIKRAEKKDVLVVPKAALITEGKDNYLFLEKEGKAHRQRVELGIDSGNEVEIIEGLTVGERLIIKGQHYIEDSDPVMIRGKQE